MEPRFRFGEQITVGGYRCDEVASALQKSIRRCDEQQALYWATELDLSGYGAYAFKRLRTICSEDVGLAWTEGPAVIGALEAQWHEAKKAAGKDAKPGFGMLPIAHATLLLARAPKSRIVDNACNVYYGHRETLEFEIPDYALDSHTAKGRSMGRSEQNHYAESYGVAKQTLFDDYVGPAHPWMTEETAQRFARPHENPSGDQGSRLF